MKQSRLPLLCMSVLAVALTACSRETPPATAPATEATAPATQAAEATAQPLKTEVYTLARKASSR